ncbi:MAG: nodulation protein NfeD [Xanthobacteraceae bacterium]|nr:nodulation protein NfeD [Xanthobacteraceae bacterium]
MTKAREIASAARRLVGAAGLAVVALLFAMPPGGGQSGRVLTTDISGAIGVASARQITRAIEQAQRTDAALLVIRLDTPGGLVTSTREIIKMIVAAPVPVAIYVAPSGARAASAGTFMVYAAHVAAMAPGTNLGAATPVQMGGVPGLPQPKEGERKDGKEQSENAAQRKAINDVVALLRSLAQLRGRNAEFAEKAVREAATLTADEARREGVVDIVAGTLPDLLAQLDGRRVKVGESERVLATRGVTPTAYEPDWRTRLLGAISDPNVAFILLLIGFYGLIFEFWSPGSFVPGTIGAISLILALTALSTLPVHYGALALLVLGLALMVAEAFTPGIGVLGLGGLAAFVVGSVFLFEGADADIDFAVSLPLIVGASLTSAALAFFVIGAALKARQRPPATGAEEMIGISGQVVEWAGDRGRVRVHGEVWSARARVALAPRQPVRVVAREGLTLIVEPHS